MGDAILAVTVRKMTILVDIEWHMFNAISKYARRAARFVPHYDDVMMIMMMAVPCRAVAATTSSKR